MNSSFDVLPLDEKIQKLYREGEYVMSIRYYAYKVNLYLIDQSYQEVFYHHRRGEIESIDPLDATHSRMQFYADQIRVNGIILNHL